MCKTRGANGEVTERTHDYVIACTSLQSCMRDMEVVEDLESRAHKAISVAVQKNTRCRNSMCKKCLRPSQGSAEADCREEERR